MHFWHKVNSSDTMCLTSLFYVVSQDKIEKRDRSNNIVGQINISLDSTLIQNSKLVFTSQAQYIVSYPDDKVFKSSSNSFFKNRPITST